MVTNLCNWCLVFWQTRCSLCVTIQCQYLGMVTNLCKYCLVFWQTRCSLCVTIQGQYLGMVTNLCNKCLVFWQTRYSLCVTIQVCLYYIFTHVRHLCHVFFRSMFIIAVLKDYLWRVSAEIHAKTHFTFFFECPIYNMCRLEMENTMRIISIPISLNLLLNGSNTLNVKVYF